DIGDMYEAITMGARHPRIHKGDDMARAIHCCAADVHAGPQRAKAMFVGRRDLDHRDIDRQNAPPEKLWDLAKEDRHIVAVDAIGNLSVAGRNEKRIDEKALAPKRIVEIQVAHKG